MLRRIKAKGLSLLWLTALLIGLLVSAQITLAVPTCTVTCYVATTGSDLNTGTSAAFPLRNIQTGIDEVNDGGEVIVAAGTYTENLTIDSRELLITGAGAGATIIDGDATAQVFEINGSDVTIDAVTITNGAGGGGTGGGVNSNFSDVIITDSLITDNVGGSGAGVLAALGGSMTITGSTISDNTSTFGGGGIYMSVGPDLTLVDSTVSGNSAPQFGGGVTVSRAGPALIEGSTIVGNSAGTNGGGIWNDITTLTVINSTVSGNEAGSNGGGLYNNNDGDSDGATLSAITNLTNVTFFGNDADDGGGIYNRSVFGGVNDTQPENPATINITNTIVAESDSNNCVNFASGGGIATFNSNDYNLSDDTSCAAFFTEANDLNDASPNLGALADNGGPTETHALLAGSEAIDAGSDTGVGEDQRNIARPQGAGFDIGAYEAQPAPPDDGTVTAYKFEDLLADGNNDPEDPPLDGWTFVLYDAMAVDVDAGVTAADGTVTLTAAPGSYQLCEVVQAAWFVSTGSACQNVVIPEGASAGTFEFGNYRRGTITIAKQTNPDGSLTEFGFTSPWFNDYLADGGTAPSGPLNPGTYTISESDVPIGWALDNIDCGGASTTPNGLTGVDVELLSGQNITCTFNNVQLSNIVIDKIATGAGALEFDFTIDGEIYDNFPFTLTDAGGDGLFDNIPAGTYVVIETNIPPGWTLETIDCGDADVVYGATSVTITLAIGETVYCDFTNIPAEAAIHIDKTVDDTTADVGQMVNYTYTVTNTGDVTLTGVTVVDDLLGPITLGDTELNPDEVTVGVASYTVLEADLPGPIVNIATATGTPPFGDDVSDSDSVEVAINPPLTCEDIDPETALSGYIVIGGGTATGYVTNNSALGCEFQIGLASYEKYDDNIDNQIGFDYENPTLEIGPGDTVSLTVDLPDCAAQVDLFYGPVIWPTFGGLRYGTRLLAVVHVGGTDYCGRDTSTPEPDPTEQVTPEVTPTEEAALPTEEVTQEAPPEQPGTEVDDESTPEAGG